MPRHPPERSTERLEPRWSALPHVESADHVGANPGAVDFGSPEYHVGQPEDLRFAERRLRDIVREELQAAIRDMEQAQPCLLTAREAARILRVDERTLRRLVVEGSVPQPLHIGRRAIRWDATVLYRSLGMDRGAP